MTRAEVILQKRILSVLGTLCLLVALALLLVDLGDRFISSKKCEEYGNLQGVSTIYITPSCYVSVSGDLYPIDPTLWK